MIYRIVFFIIGKKIQEDLPNQEIMGLKLQKEIGLHFWMMMMFGKKIN